MVNPPMVAHVNVRFQETFDSSFLVSLIFKFCVSYVNIKGKETIDPVSLFIFIYCHLNFVYCVILIKEQNTCDCQMNNIQIY